MSMLSQQAKALRSWADQLAEREDEFGVAVRALVADLREAADTILSLRDRLLEAELGDDGYERKMDALLCRSTNGKYSKSREYDLDFMEQCVNEEFEELYSENLAADATDGQRDGLQESYGQYPEQGERENGGERESCGTRWHQLFGTPEWAELQSQLAEAERRAAMFERVAEDQKARNRDMRSTVNAVTGADADSRWFDLFGTPERAARTMAGKCGDCCECVIADYCEHGSGEGCLLSYAGDYDALLEWLKQEVKR